jgi:hypothetical protein
MLFWVYALMFVFAVIGLACMFLLPGGSAEQYSYKGASEDAVDAETVDDKPEITMTGYQNF